MSLCLLQWCPYHLQTTPLYDISNTPLQQEDEDELVRRKQAQEEQPVDVLTIPDSPPLSVSRSHFRPYPFPQSRIQTTTSNGTVVVDVDEDYAWADDDPDEDLAAWNLKVLLEEEAEEGEHH